MDAKMVEIVARALAKSDGLNFDEVCALDAGEDDCDSSTCVAACIEDHDSGDARRWYLKSAQAVITALTEAGMIVPEGCVAVPVEPTEEMVRRGIEQATDCTDNWSASGPCVAEHVYAAMLAAAKEG